jgi:ribosomal protein S18 acetylase RimI-like enzyme
MNDAEIKGKEAPRKRSPRFEVEIREMELDDIPTVFHLGEQLFTATRVPNLYRTWDEFEVVELFHGDSQFCLVAESEGKIIGFALGTTISKTRSAWKYGHLVWLGVDPRYQRYRIGKKLFRNLKNLMLEEGVRILLVDTEADNASALAFFQELGFGNPEEHTYLSLNLDRRKRRKRQNGAG